MKSKRMELSMEELEQVNGGADALQTTVVCAGGGVFGGLIAGSYAAVLGLAAGPVGWVMLGGAAVGAAAFGIYNAVTED